MKFSHLVLATGLMLSPAYAASLSSVECSASQLVLTFDASVASGDVTAIEIGEGDSPRFKYELNLSGTASGSTLTYTVDDTALGQMGKVAPHKAYIFATGTASGSAKCS
jgi:hypothetical protein